MPTEMCAHTAHKAGAVRGCAQSKGSTLQERIVHKAHKEGAQRSGNGLHTVGLQTRRSSLSKPGPDFSNLHSNRQKSQFQPSGFEAKNCGLPFLKFSYECRVSQDQKFLFQSSYLERST